MNSTFKGALVLFLATLLPAETPVYTSFKADKPLIHIARYSSLLPTFGFGPSASFDNPALLASIYGQEIAVSSQDLSRPLSLALSYGGRFLENAAMGGGLSFYSRDGYFENHSIFSFASSGDNIDFGANIKFMLANKVPDGSYDKTLYAMDIDLGLLAGSASRIYAGAAVFNLLSTPFLHTHSFSVSPERAIKIQAGGFLDHERNYCLFAEGRVDSLHDAEFANYSVGGGGEAAFLRERSLKLRLGFLSQRAAALPDRVNTLLSAVRFEFPLQGNAVKIEYGLNYMFDNTGMADAADLLSHYAQVSLGLGGREDFTPPVVSVVTDNPAFTPDGDNHLDNVAFLIHCEDNPGGSGIRKWALTICRKKENNKLEILKAFTGTGLPPRVIQWDGRDAGKTLLDKGVYFYQFRAVDRANNSTDARPQPIRID